ncbi:MAG: glycosyltransferase family 4 protein [Nanoarchaeota archaeon]
MRICFFTTCFAEHKQLRLSYAEKYIPKASEIFLATPKTQDKYELERTKIIHIDEDKLSSLIYLRRFCKKNKVNFLTNLGTPLESYALLFSSIFTNVKFIINIHGNALEAYKIQKNLRKKLIELLRTISLSIPFIFSDKIIFGAQDQAELIKKYFFPFKHKILHLPLILNEKIFFKKNKLEMRKKLGLPLNKEIIIFVGRIQYLKGSDTLFQLAKNNKEKYFVLIGKEEDNSFSKNKLKNVLVLPSIKNEALPDYYSASDLSILPSRIEGFGIVSRESMLCETPALVSNITALKSIPGVITSENNISDMQKQIDNFFSMPENERSKMGQNNRKAIIKETSYNNLKERYMKAFI